MTCPDDLKSYLADGRVQIVTYIANPDGGCVPQIKNEGIPQRKKYKPYPNSGSAPAYVPT